MRLSSVNLWRLSQPLVFFFLKNHCPFFIYYRQVQRSLKAHIRSLFFCQNLCSFNRNMQIYAFVGQICNRKYSFKVFKMHDSGTFLTLISISQSPTDRHFYIICYPAQDDPISRFGTSAQTDGRIQLDLDVFVYDF